MILGVLEVHYFVLDAKFGNDPLTDDFIRLQLAKTYWLIDCLKYALKIMDKTYRDRLPANICLFKVNNRSSRKMCEIC